MTKEIKQISLRLPKPLHEQLEKEADINKRSTNGEIVKILEDHCESKKDE